MNEFIILAAVLFIYITFWYIVALIKKRNDLADVAWGLGFPVLCWFAFFIFGHSLRSLIINILITIWGCRLAIHIYLRNKDKPEDSRYATWRKEWKHFRIRSFLQIFLLQGALLFVISYPAVFINVYGSEGISFFDVIGVVIWIVGFYFEVVGDSQLTTFVKDEANRGRIMQSGLWKYSRHPNYFGEVTMWWGIFITALSLPDGLYTIVGPLTITYLIVFVSGIPLLEKGFSQRPGFEEYKKRTSVFFPLPPKVI